METAGQPRGQVLYRTKKKKTKKKEEEKKEERKRKNNKVMLRFTDRRKAR